MTPSRYKRRTNRGIAGGHEWPSSGQTRLWPITRARRCIVAPACELCGGAADAEPIRILDLDPRDEPPDRIHRRAARRTRCGAACGCAGCGAAGRADTRRDRHRHTVERHRRHRIAHPHSERDQRQPDQYCVRCRDRQPRCHSGRGSHQHAAPGLCRSGRRQPWRHGRGQRHRHREPAQSREPAHPRSDRRPPPDAGRSRPRRRAGRRHQQRPRRVNPARRHRHRRRVCSLRLGRARRRRQFHPEARLRRSPARCHCGSVHAHQRQSDQQRRPRRRRHAL